MIKNEITPAEIITIILTIVGGGFALFQWFKNSIIKRAAYYNDAYIKLREDKDISSVLHMIDYEQEYTPWYPFDPVKGEELERKVDKTLGYLDYLCYLRQKNLIKENEFKNIEYRIFRVGNNTSALNYLYNLYHFSKANGTVMSFSFLLDHLDQKQKIILDFWNNESKEFIHHLIP